MQIRGVDTFLVEVPQRYPIAPYQSRYRAASSTKALLVRLTTDDGLVGWGETPQRYLGEQLTGHEAVALRPALVGRDPRDVEALDHLAAELGGDSSGGAAGGDLSGGGLGGDSSSGAAGGDLSGGGLGSDSSGGAACDTPPGLDGTYVQSAVEMACWDLTGKSCGLPLYRLLGGLVRRRIELAACMGIRPANEAAAIARQYVAEGFTTLKTKAGRDPEEDLDMVRAIRGAVGDRLRLRIDPNMGYSPEVAAALARDLEPYGLEYLEQPMAAGEIAASAALRGRTRTPLALNESVTTLAAVRSILEQQAADVLLPDTYQCGGIRAVQRVAHVAESAGVACVVHCAHDLGLKTAAMLHLAASTSNFSLANDCTYYSLVDDVLADRIAINGGDMLVPEGPGLGVDVDLARVRRFQLAASC